jgi:tetratricopeptide (TPR) repeat protein
LKDDVWPLAPLFAISIAAGLMTIWVERNFVGTSSPGYTLTLLQRPLVAGRAIWFYLWKLIWPANVGFIYPRWNIDPTQWWQWLYPLAAIVVTVDLWMLRDRWRAPLSAWLLYWVMLLPLLGFVNTSYFDYTFVSDHFQYLPALGIIIPASAALAHAIDRLPRAGSTIGIALCAVQLAVWAAMTWSLSANFANAIVYNQRTLAYNPNCWVAHYNLGVRLAATGDHKAAIDEYRTTIHLRPDIADPHYNLGYSLVEVKNLPEAIAETKTCITLQPGYWKAYVNLTRAYALLNQPNDAIASAQRAISIARKAGHPLEAGGIENWLKQYERKMKQTDFLSSPSPAAPAAPVKQP